MANTETKILDISTFAFNILAAVCQFVYTLLFKYWYRN